MDNDVASSLFFGYALTAATGPTDGSGPFAFPDTYVPTNLAPWSRMTTNQESAGSAGDSVFIGTPDPSDDQGSRSGDRSGATETYTYNFITKTSGPARMGAAGTATVSASRVDSAALPNAGANDAPDSMTTNELTGNELTGESGGPAAAQPAETARTADSYVYTPIRHRRRSVAAGVSFTAGANLDPGSQVDMPVELFLIAPNISQPDPVGPADPAVAAGGSLLIPLTVVNTEIDDLMSGPLPIFYDVASLLAVPREGLIARLKDIVGGPAGVAVLGGSLAGLAGLAGLVGLASLAFHDRRRKP
jgi:hypothetical protein